ncbi:MAG: AMP-binding protein [Chloroflexi bacterium]|nr:AMP-binding protein [Chloroflexota bacterium]
MPMTHDGLSHWQAEAGTTPLIDTTIGDLLDQRAEEFPAQAAVVYSCYPEYGPAFDVRWSYAHYRQRVNAVARGLIAIGLERGDHIGIWAANVPDWPVLMLAANKAGLVVVTINPVLQAREVEYILEQGDVRALFFMARVRDNDHLATVRSLTTHGASHGEVTSQRVPLLKYVGLIGPAPADVRSEDGWRPTLVDEVIGAGAAVTEQDLAERQASVSPGDPAALMYTSGTTGFPKGALLTHHGLVNNAALISEWLAPTLTVGGRELHDMRTCVLFPFFHAAGLVGILCTVYSGQAMCPLVGFDPLKAMQVISRERCAYTGGVPTMLTAILQHPDFGAFDLSSLALITSGAAPVPVLLMEQVKERIGADIAIVFGQTEGHCCLTSTLPDDAFELKATTVGKPLPYLDVKIVEPGTDRVVPVGERGEFLYHGWAAMQGYYHMADKTAETIDAEGWVHSGDLATMNAHGYVNIVGRLKDMVIRGGENLFPREIEEFLLRHPGVADVQVVGVPDAYFGEELLAVVIPRDGAQLSESDLREYCAGKLSHQKTPRYFQFVHSFPLTGSGKVQKFKLREQAIHDLGLEPVANRVTA